MTINLRFWCWRRTVPVRPLGNGRHTERVCRHARWLPWEYNSSRYFLGSHCGCTLQIGMQTCARQNYGFSLTRTLFKCTQPLLCASTVLVNNGAMSNCTETLMERNSARDCRWRQLYRQEHSSCTRALQSWPVLTRCYITHSEPYRATAPNRWKCI